MALHRLEQITLGAPSPEIMDTFYQEINMVGGDRSWGSAARKDQIQIEEYPYRQLLAVRIACDDEADLAAAATRLDALGVRYYLGNGRLSLQDPINKWTYTLEPLERNDVPLNEKPLLNYPGDRPRENQRVTDRIKAKTPAPRRLGHVVIASPEPVKTIELAMALGFRLSDSGFDGNVAFLRCSHDHHNLLVSPGPIPYLNHYALEQDDFDSVFQGATRFLAKHGEEAQISGPGRHPFGGNIFWYMLDPSGNFFEFFADIDQITDDDAWVPNTAIDAVPMDEGWSIWCDPIQPEVFFEPKDFASVMEGWTKMGGNIESRHSKELINLLR